MSRRLSGLRSSMVVLALILGSVTGCARATGSFVWVDDFRPPVAPVGEYRIAPGDLVAIRVWDHDEMSVRARVRTDGRLTIPLLDDVEVAGQGPEAVARSIEERLGERNLVVNPKVVVVLEETRPLSVAVLGEVMRAGMYTLENGAGVAEALASAGGLSEFASRDNIYVIRRSPSPVRVRFTYRALSEASGRAATFVLQPGDLVVAQ